MRPCAWAAVALTVGWLDGWLAGWLADRGENPQTDSQTDSPTDSVLIPLARLVAFLLCVLSVCLVCRNPLPACRTLSLLCGAVEGACGRWPRRAHTSASSEGPTGVPPCIPPAIDCEAASLSVCLSVFMHMCVCVCVRLCLSRCHLCAVQMSLSHAPLPLCLSASLPACLPACVAAWSCMRLCVGVSWCLGVWRCWCASHGAVFFPPLQSFTHCVACLPACHRVSMMMCQCVSVSVCVCDSASVIHSCLNECLTD